MFSKRNHQFSIRHRVARLSSAIAFLAITITLVFGNRNVAFGTSISGADQLTLWLISGTLLLIHLIVAIAARWKSRPRGLEEIVPAQKATVHDKDRGEGKI